MSTYNELLQSARAMLKEQQIADAELDAWYLLSNVFKISRTDLLLQGDNTVSEADREHFLKLVKVRAKHVPLQHITGTQEFMGLEFEVTPDVLIPRQDTEILVEEVLKRCDGKSVLDMCTGSGCIIVSTARLGRPSRTVGVDISESALKVASQNAQKHQVKIELLKSDLFDQVVGCFDIIVSNPPYIPTNIINELMPEVKDHEPVIALDGYEDGLYFYRRIAAAIDKHLSSQGIVLFEIGYDQGEAVKAILLKVGLHDVKIIKDLSGLDRVVSARKS